ncbi:hypothetical protein MUK42_34389 [Musa troglodytarum]|uniref:Uncharacterized protein n=1 Tax=Musa troglodytarum TaxID=320322 RepID=A0A9E7HJC6_9LILI|nr:hypothetical protein MUK42_34389 [Musa troglodytarum]
MRGGRRRRREVFFTSVGPSRAGGGGGGGRSTDHARNGCFVLSKAWITQPQEGDRSFLGFPACFWSSSPPTKLFHHLFPVGLHLLVPSVLLSIQPPDFDSPLGGFS